MLSHCTKIDLILFYKIFNGLVSSEIQRLFVLNDSIVHNLSSHAFKLNIFKPRIDLLKYNILKYVYRISECWNYLPAYICKSASLSIFKQRLTFYLNSNTLHNLVDNYCIKCVIETSVLIMACVCTLLSISVSRCFFF